MNAVVSVDIDAAIAELTATTAAQGTVVASVEAFIAGFPAALAAAVAAAKAAGATPAQLASFDSLNAALLSNSAGLTAAIVTPPVVGAAAGP